LKTKVYIVLAIAFIAISCSTEKNAPLNRAYHNTTLKYNIYFNANEAYKRGLNRIYSQNTDDYTDILPIFIDTKEELASSASGEMDKTIQKCSKGIKYHSITKRPKLNDNPSKKEQEFYKKNEFNKWIDDCYLLMGKSYFIKRDYSQARNNFEYLIRQFPDLETKYLAYLYLTRTFSESGNFRSAKETLDLIEADKEFPKKFLGQFNAIYADFYLKQKMYDDAIPKLVKAINGTKKKKEKLRYTFILAQIYEKKGNFQKASELYEIVTKKNPGYEMEFNARINMARCYAGSSKGSKEVYKKLRKMLKDDKNIEYRDQIYYALAELDYRNNNLNEAIKNYRLSSATSVSNNNQKALSCLRLGEIYFSIRDYKNAQLYYDSCMAFLPLKYPNYDEIKTTSVNLNELVKYTYVVEFEDSVQRLAKMSEAERFKIIDKIIQDIIAEETRQREEEQQAQINSMLFDQQRGNTMNNVRAPSGGAWYFYNPSQLSFGKNEFTKKWGNRKNEDHWRRKNKSIIESENDRPEDTSDTLTASSNQKKFSNPKDRQYYLQDIPLTDSAMKASNEKLKEAFFNMGRVYKDRFSDYKLAIEAYEELNKRFPNNEYLLQSFYNLYLLNKLINNEAEAEKYKNLVISKFPDTNYAKLLLNPNYVNEVEAKRRADEQLYINTYDDYMASRYNNVIRNVNNFIAENPESNLVPNFEFLKVLTTGRTGELDLFKQELISFIKKYPQHELFTAAQNLLVYLGATNIDDLIAELKTRPNEEIKSEDDTSASIQLAEKESYVFEENVEHYYAIYVNAKDVDIKRLSFEIRNFNIFTFSMRTFNVINVPFNNDSEIITVRSFNNKRQVVNYSKMIANSTDVFDLLKNVNYKIFVISADNYKKLQKNRNLNEYLQFYKENY